MNNLIFKLLIIFLTIELSACGDNKTTEVKAFLLITESINNVCFENMKLSLNQPFLDKYEQGKKNPWK
jgi:hypothetical protein